ncbi:MAG: hypothetical protein Q4C47_08490, partial [Planctomycetia bacterium]|nr:hypothetical protein [Planctomycetia bacterium]
MKKQEISRRTFSGMAAGLAGLFGMRAVDVPWMGNPELFAMETGELRVPEFVKAKPVWAKGREKEMNMTLVFLRGGLRVPAGKADGYILRMTGSTIARVVVNGQMVGYGPARGPHGWFRIDEWKIGPYLEEEGVNHIEIEIAGYNSNSYYLLDQPSFLQAEIVDGDGNVVV